MQIIGGQIDPIHDTLFWCGHHVFNEQNIGTLETDDITINIAPGIEIVVCPNCLIQLGNAVLTEGVFLGGSTDPITLWCGHREWIDDEGQPAAGDITLELIKDMDGNLVCCPDCAGELARRVIEKAIQRKCDDVENLEELIAGD